MKEIRFKVIPTEGFEKEALAISGMSFAMTINGETYNIRLEQPGEMTVTLKLKTEGKVTLKANDIVLICPAEASNSKKSNNKRIVVNHRYTGEICDFSVKNELKEKFGDALDNFLEIDRAVWVNVKYIAGLTANDKAVVKYYDVDGNEKTEKLPISRRHLSSMKRKFDTL